MVDRVPKLMPYYEQRHLAMPHIGFQQRKQRIVRFVKVHLDLPRRVQGEEPLTDGC